MFRTFTVSVVFCVVCFAGVVGNAWGVVKYTVTDLGTLGGEGSWSQDINNSGQVVGAADTTPGENGYHAYRTAPNSPIDPATDDLGTLGFAWGVSIAYGINDSGQVVGYSFFSTGNDSYHAYRTAPNSPINPATDDLGTLPGGTYHSSYANDINDSGQVVGYSDNYGIGGPGKRAFLYSDNGPMQDLGTLGGTYSNASGINNSGQVVGSSYTSGDAAMRAFLHSGSGPLTAADDLGTLGGTSSSATGINNSGQVVGSSYTSGNASYHAFRTAANQPINPDTDDLGTLPGYTDIYAFGINNSGQVVGVAWASGGTASRPFVFSDTGPMQDLNDLIDSASGWTLKEARAINDLGQIVGAGTIGGQSHAFRLDPVPEPSTLVLLGMGAFAFLAWAWRRRRA